jgi:hypothetical protein
LWVLVLGNFFIYPVFIIEKEFLASDQSLGYNGSRIGRTPVGKSKRGEREFSKEQKLIHENRILKRQVASLRKQLARLDLDRYDNLKETIEQHYQEDSAQEGQYILEKIKKEWACQEPGCDGFLEIFTYNKVGDTWYYRICSAAPACKNRTKAQKYSLDVKGIKRKSNESK